MRRRQYMQTAGSLAVLPMNSLYVQQDEPDLLETIATEFFESLPDSEERRSEAVTSCANALCEAQKTISAEVMNSVREGGATVDDFIRRLRFGVRTLNEYNITTVVEESTLERSGQRVDKLTSYLPLLGSFNNLCDAACKVETPNPSSEQVKDFLFAAIAFGVEIGLWSIGAPYKIAFKGTRFVANKTFLRFARHGCRGCVALAMSEIHWAIRGTIYSDAVTQNKIQFIYEQVDDLHTKSQALEYDADLDYSYEEIREIVQQEDSNGGSAVGPTDSEGFLEGLLDFNLNFDFDITLPKIPNISDVW